MNVNLDFGRFARRGYPEAIYCEGKTLADCAAIATAWSTASGAGTAIFTRVDTAKADAILDVLPDAFYDADASLIAWPAQPPPAVGGAGLVVCAGTSDYPVAREAELTMRYLGANARCIADVGVAGLSRILAHKDELSSADVVVVVAGMDAALVPVVAGLVSCPVVACPTSVGYGASFSGVAALLSMLNSCAPGVGVVNIDNGYGAGHLAAQIARGGQQCTTS